MDLVQEYQELVKDGKMLETMIQEEGRSPARDVNTPRAVLIEKAFYEWLYQ
jgi:hypothetical protein